MSNKRFVDFNTGLKFSCSCKARTKVNYLINSGCSDDVSAVAVLPYHWTPRKGGSTLAKYLQEREECHVKVLKDLQESASLVNEQIESRVRNLAENLTCNIKSNQRDVDCVITKQKLIDGRLPAESRDDALKSVEYIISVRLRDISDFKEEALELENERANGLRKVLHDHFGSLMDVHHENPKELFRQFDEKIYEINQQLLSNRAAYIELEEQWRAQAKQNKIKARSLINQLCLGVVIENRGRSALHCSNNSLDINKRSKSANQINASIVSAKQSINTVVEFDACIHRFTEEYRNAIGNTYAEFADKLSDLFKRIGDPNFIKRNICCAKEVDILERKVQQSFSRLSELKLQSAMDVNKYLSDFADYVKMMQQSLLSVGNQLKGIYTLLNEASHLWDAHMIRLALAEKLTMAAVEDLATRNDSLELANDIPFNIILEQLLTANDVDKLQQYYEALNMLHRQKADEYLQHGDNEISRLEEIMKLLVPLTNIVQAEFDLFVNKYPITNYKSINEDDEDTVQVTHPRISTFNMKLQTSLPRDIFQTEVQEIALNNWRNGFLDRFRHSLPLLSEKLEHQLLSWIDERSVPLKKRHAFKMLSLEIRKERVIAARDMRLSQLRQHEDCLESHLLAINELTNGLPIEVCQLLTLDASGLYPIKEWVEKIKTKMDELNDTKVDVEVKRLKMMSYAIRFANHRRLFEESLTSIVESTKKLIGQRLQMARVSNVRYVSHLKLFGEGGSHSAAQAAKICATLVKAGDLVEHCMVRSLDVLNQRRVELLLQADQLINPLKAIGEDTLKETGKGAYDRKKVLSSKKR